jgi:hypothetical protein
MMGWRVINNVSKRVTLAVLVGLAGCDKQPDPAPPPVQATAPVVQGAFDPQQSESVGYKLLVADRGRMPSFTVDAPLIDKLNQQLSDLNRLTGLEEMHIANMALVGARTIREQYSDVSVSAAEVLEMLAMVLPTQQAELAGNQVDKRKLFASNMNQYASMRSFGSTHREAVDSMAALNKKLRSPEFAARMNEVINRHPELVQSQP